MTTQPALADTSNAAAEVARGSSAATAQAPDAAQPAAGAGSLLLLYLLTFKDGEVVSSVPVTQRPTVPEASGSPAAADETAAGSERSRKRGRQEDDVVEAEVAPLRTRSPQQPRPKRLRTSATSSVRLSNDAPVLPAF